MLEKSRGVFSSYGLLVYQSLGERVQGALGDHFSL
jgi:hypothetical protein